MVVHQNKKKSVSKIAPRFILENVDKLIALGADAGAKGDHQVGGFVANVEGSMDGVFRYEDGITWA